MDSAGTEAGIIIEYIGGYVGAIEYTGAIDWDVGRGIGCGDTDNTQLNKSPNANSNTFIFVSFSNTFTFIFISFLNTLNTITNKTINNIKRIGIGSVGDSGSRSPTLSFLSIISTAGAPRTDNGVE